jgi:hypothetical protein
VVAAPVMSTWQWIKILFTIRSKYNAAEAAARKEAPMKSLFASKVFWFNMIAAAIGTAQSAGLFTLIPDPYGPAVWGLVNIVLRYITVQPVAITGTSLTGPPVADAVATKVTKITE